ncbi:MAG: DUF262 domain-containing protein [Rhodospirillales bacterium]|nr:DUF262 domain-containing protein [Rhodospirillales bacterium]
MDANTRKLERIFDQTITYQVPLFQRPYVWTQDANWMPLWEDIQELLDKHLRGEPAHPHFLGAVVLEQLANSTGSIESRQVIDGQQRFTTLQLFLMAARDLATDKSSTKYIERFTDLVANRRSKIDFDDEVFKVWPTNSNRAAYRLIHESGSPEKVDKKVKLHPTQYDASGNIIDAYKFFHVQLLSWMEAKLDDDEDADILDAKNIEDRFDSLWHVVRDCLQVVVIDLDSNDETQVIFETLNARGEDLLPADLIKNYIFRRAVQDLLDVEELYADHWQRLETPWWRDAVKQGRITRPRVDVFINYYLAMMTLDDVKSSHLFNAFKMFFEKPETAIGSMPAATEEPVIRSLIVVPKNASEHIAQLSRYANVFEAFYKTNNHPRLEIFLRRLEAIDTTTVFPFMLYAHAELMPENQIEFDKILVLIESYLIRRMVCGLTGKNYNRYFIDMMRALDKKGVLSAAGVAEYMEKSTSDSTLYPDDLIFKESIFNLPLYGRLAQYKVRSILEALNVYSRSSKSEEQPLPDGLTIEHVMPQKWQAHWPLNEELVIDSESGKIDPIQEQKAIQKRERIINTLGNLTLITSSLNPALSNSSWTAKRPELLKEAPPHAATCHWRYLHRPHSGDEYRVRAVRVLSGDHSRGLGPASGLADGRGGA